MAVYCRKCGKKCQNMGAVTLHEATCKGEADQGKAKSGDKCKECGAVGSMQLLKASEHKELIDQGYSHFCDKCLEVY